MNQIKGLCLPDIITNAIIRKKQGPVRRMKSVRTELKREKTSNLNQKRIEN